MTGGQQARGGLATRAPVPQQMFSGAKLKPTLSESQAGIALQSVKPLPAAGVVVTAAGVVVTVTVPTEVVTAGRRAPTALSLTPLAAVSVIVAVTRTSAQEVLLHKISMN